MITVYHNNRCGKSRGAICLLEEAGKQIEIIEYLKQAPSIEELKSIHFKQLTTYLKLTDKKLGLLVNFNCLNILDNIHRIVNKI